MNELEQLKQAVIQFDPNSCQWDSQREPFPGE
jgi:hypothetical protein